VHPTFLANSFVLMFVLLFCRQGLIIFSVIRSLKLLMRRKFHCFWKYSGEYAYEITCLICACLCFLFFKCEQHIGNTWTHALFLQIDMMWYVKLFLSKTVHKDGGKLQSSWVPVCLFTHWLRCVVVLMFQILRVVSHGAKKCCNIDVPIFRTDTWWIE